MSAQNIYATSQLSRRCTRDKVSTAGVYYSMHDPINSFLIVYGRTTSKHQKKIYIVTNYFILQVCKECLKAYVVTWDIGMVYFKLSRYRFLKAFPFLHLLQPGLNNQGS